jgi:hypothetical protein
VIDFDVHCSKHFVLLFADISAQQTQYTAVPQGGQYASAGMAQPAYGMSGTAAGASDYGGYAQQQATSVSDYATAQTASYGTSAYVATAPVVNQTGYAPADVIGQVQDSQASLSTIAAKSVVWQARLQNKPFDSTTTEQLSRRIGRIGSRIAMVGCWQAYNKVSVKSPGGQSTYKRIHSVQ